MKFGSSGTIETDLIIELYRNVRAFVDTYEEVNFTLTDFSEHIVLRAEQSNSEEASFDGLWVSQYANSTTIEDKENCDPEKILREFLKRGYKIGK